MGFAEGTGRAAVAGVLALAMLCVGQVGCTAAPECFADSDCGSDEICNGGQCAAGSRGGGDFDVVVPGDAVYPADIDIVQGDAPVYTQDGPEIEIVSPRPFELVDNVIQIVAVVRDVDGVDTENVWAIIADQHSVKLDWDSDAGLFAALFDTDLIGRMVFPVLDVTATDIGGNSNTVGMVFSLDNEPPDISFDSRLIYAHRYGVCTAPWQVLGNYGLRDGHVIDSNYWYGLAAFPRLRIQDDGNRDAVNIPLPVPVFGVDDNSTFLYAIDSQASANNSIKLLTSSGAGPQCDQINPAVAPDPLLPDAPDKAIVVNLVPHGNAFEGSIGLPNFLPVAFQPVPLPFGCNSVGLAAVDVCIGAQPCCHEPDPICPWNGEPLTYIPCYPGPQNPDSLETECHPMVYGVGAFSTSSTLICSGGAFDAFNLVADGVVCLTASAADRRGNLAFAAPIAVCVDKDGSGDCIGFPSDTAANLCTDGCTPADGFGTAADTAQGISYPWGIYNHCY